jgi:hypothetical protein
LEECPPGHFAWRYGGDHECIGFKSEYHRENGGMEVFNEAGEYLTLDSPTDDVQPLEVSWGEE